MNATPKWENVLLTDSGFYDTWEGKCDPYPAVIERFARMLGKPFAEARMLFIPTAAYSPPNLDYDYVEICKQNLLLLGVLQENITTHDIDGSLSESDALTFDVIFFTGGNTPYLAKRVKDTGFDAVIRKMVYANKVYVGISAGSMFAMRYFNVQGLIESNPGEFGGLGLINVQFSVHNEPGTPTRTDLPLPHIAMSSGQALAVSSDGYELIG